MTVLSIAASPDRRGRHRVEFSDGTALKLPPSVIADLQLYTGRELDESELARVREAERKADARQRAVNIISATTVSGRELSDRLRRKGASEQDAAEAVQWLQELNLVDDARTARQIVERGVRRGYGERRIRQMLYEKRSPGSTGTRHWKPFLPRTGPSTNISAPICTAFRIKRSASASATLWRAGALIGATFPPACADTATGSRHWRRNRCALDSFPSAARRTRWTVSR